MSSSTTPSPSSSTHHPTTDPFLGFPSQFLQALEEQYGNTLASDSFRPIPAPHTLGGTSMSKDFDMDFEMLRKMRSPPASYDSQSLSDYSG